MSLIVPSTGKEVKKPALTLLAALSGGDSLESERVPVPGEVEAVLTPGAPSKKAIRRTLS